MRAYKLLAILLMAIFTSSAFAQQTFTQLDRFEKRSLFGITKSDNWYNYKVSGSLSNLTSGVAGDTKPLCLVPDNCIEIRGVSVSGSNVVGIGMDLRNNIGNETINDGKSYKYDLSQCTSFSYEYKGEAHSIHFNVADESYPESWSSQQDQWDNEWGYLKNFCNIEKANEKTSDWTPVVITTDDLVRCKDKVGNWGNNTSLAGKITTAAMKKVIQLQWRVGADGEKIVGGASYSPAAVTNGSLKIRNLQCIGANIFMEPEPDIHGVYGKKLSEIPALATQAGVEGFEWVNPTTTTLTWAAEPTYREDKKGAKFYYKDVDATYTHSGLQAVPGKITVWVDPAEAADFAPTDLTATYGQTLAQVTPALSTGWTWIKATSTSVGNAGQQTFNVKYDGKQHPLIRATPGTAGIPVTITVNKATPATPTKRTTTYGKKLSEVELPLVDGVRWTWADATPAETTVGNAGTKTFKANYAGSTNYLAATEVDVEVQVNKANATAPTITAVTYTPTLKLSGVQLPEGWSWVVTAPATAATTAVGDAGTKTTFKAKFAGNENINATADAGIAVSFVVNKGPAVAPTGITATYGQTLSQVTLGTGWSWVLPGTTSVGNVGTNTFKAKFTGNTNMAATTDPAGIDVNVAVGKAASVFGNPAIIQNIQYTPTLKLSDIALTGTYAGYAWKEPTTALTTIGNGQSFPATFTKDGNTENYTTVEGTIKVNVIRATPEFGEVTKNKTYVTGLKLGDIALDEGYTWVTPDALLNAGDNQSFAAKFLKNNDGTKYNTVNGTIKVNVAKASGLVATDYTIMVPSAKANIAQTFDLRKIILNKSDFGTPIVYKDANSTTHGNVLTAEPAISGTTLTYTGKGVADEGHTTTIHITISSQNYEDITANVLFKSTPYIVVEITGLTARSEAYNGQAKAGFSGTAQTDENYPAANLVYTYTGTTYKGDTYAATTNRPTEAGSYVLTVSVGSTPSGYVGSETYAFNITKANGTFGTPAAIAATYTEMLKLSDLTLGAGYEFAATVNPNTALNAGNNQKFNATYTDPSGNYNVSPVGQITINVAKATTAFVEPTAVSETYTPTLTLSDLDLPAGYAWKTPGTSLNAGSAAYTAVYTKNANYNSVEGSVTVNVTKATIPAITFVAEKSYIEAPLSKSALSGSASQYGTYSWTEATTVLNAAGDKTYSATFTPKAEYLTDNYAWTSTLADNKFTNPSVSIVVGDLQDQVNDVVADIKTAVNAPAIHFSKTGIAPNEKYETGLANLGSGVTNSKASLDAYAIKFVNEILPKSLTESQKHELRLLVPGVTPLAQLTDAVDEDDANADAKLLALAEEKAADAKVVAVYKAPTNTDAGSYTFYVKVKRNPYAHIGPFVVTIPKNSNTEGSLGCSWCGTTPALPTKIAMSNISVSVTAGTIVLEKLPSNAKVEVFNMQGKRIYSSSAINSEVLRVQAQAGAYAVRVSVGSETKIMRVSLK